eukprot:4204038-Pleurochrysis_carterae.AAC.3
MGADADAADAEGRTCLMMASATGNAQAAQALLESKADPNAVDQRGVSALEEAAIHDHAHVIKLLCAAGATLQMDSLALAAKLCDCARRGFLQRLQLLLQCGADVNAADYDRHTALHVGQSRARLRLAHRPPAAWTLLAEQHIYYLVGCMRNKGYLLRSLKRVMGRFVQNSFSAEEGNAQMVSLLLSRGADRTMRDAMGGVRAGTPLDSAARKGFTDVCKLLSQPTPIAADQNR